MRKSDVYGYAFMQPKDIARVPDDSRQIERLSDVVVSSNDPSMSLLKLVYTINEVTKLPSGDLSYFVNSDANPEIKKFILDNLMMDVSSVSNHAIPDGLSDDDVFLYARASGESLDSYVNRLNNEIERTKWLNDELKKSIESNSNDSHERKEP